MTSYAKKKTRTSTDRKNAVIYARYSSASQNEQSIDGQIRVITEFAQKQGYRIVGTYIDRAMTGRNDDRPDFQRMIADSENGGFDYVIVYKLDRFPRNRYDSAVYKRTLRNNGVKVISATEQISDTPEGIMFESIIEGYSEFYSAELSSKVKRGLNESRIKGELYGRLRDLRLRNNQSKVDGKGRRSRQRSPNVCRLRERRAYKKHRRFAQ